MAIAKSHYPLLCAICASLFTTPLMVAGVNAVLPEIGASLHANAAQLSLVGAVYSLSLAIFQLSCGSLGDIQGHRRVFILGALVFAISSFCAGYASQINTFLCIRFIQGTGGALLSATGLALLAAAAPPGERPVYLGLSGAAVYSGIACGPPLAGLITGSFGWRWLFWGNAAASLLVFCLMKFASHNEWRPAAGQRFDWQGCFYYGLAMGCLTLCAATLARQPALGSGCLAGFALFIAIFWKSQARSRFPLLNPALLAQNRPLAFSCIAALVNYASFFGIIFYFSFYIQCAHHLDVQATGLILAFQPCMQALTTPLAARLCKIWPQGRVCAAGAALCGLGLLAASFLRADTPIAALLLSQGFLGSGMSLFSLANTAIIFESAGRQHIGQASGLTGAMRTAGQLASMALTTLSLTFFLGYAAVSAATLPAFMESMRSSLAIFGVLNILAVGLVLARDHSTHRANKINMLI